MEPVSCARCGGPIEALTAAEVTVVTSGASDVTVQATHATCPPPPAQVEPRRRAVRYSEFDEDEPEYERKRRR